jgi:hypothetical protein
MKNTTFWHYRRWQLIGLQAGPIIRHFYNMRLFIAAAELLCIYTSDGILKNYNQQAKTIGREL